MCEKCDENNPVVSVAADAAVVRGAELLDAHGPANWRDMIRENSDRLDIFSGYNCVAGIVFADKVDGLKWLNGYDYAYDTFHYAMGLSLAEHGFSWGTDPNGVWMGANDLTEAWLRYVGVKEDSDTV